MQYDIKIHGQKGFSCHARSGSRTFQGGVAGTLVSQYQGGPKMFQFEELPRQKYHLCHKVNIKIDLFFTFSRFSRRGVADYPIYPLPLKKAPVC